MHRLCDPVSLHRSCDPATNLNLWEKFLSFPKLEIWNKRELLIWKWHAFVCQFFAPHVILVQISICKKNFHCPQNLKFLTRENNLPECGMIPRVTSSHTT